MSPTQDIEKQVHHALMKHMVEFRQYIPLQAYINNHFKSKHPQLLLLIQLGQAYLDVDTESIELLAFQLNRTVLLNGTHLELRSYSYAHYLNHQFEQKEYMDYFRALSPLMVDLFRLVIEANIDPELNQYMEPVVKEEKDGRQIYKGLHWKQTAIESHANFIAETWHKYYGKHFNYSHYVSSSHLIKLIDDHIQREDIKEKCNQLRQIEKSIRNIVAHEAMYISDKVVLNRSLFTIDEIHRLIQEVCLMANLKDKHQWAALNEIDRDIIEIIDKNEF